MRQLFSQGVSAGTRLAQSRFGRDDDVTQDVRMQVGERPLAHGEGEDVGRPINATIAGIELLHASIVHDQQAQVTALAVEGFEQSLQRLFEPPGVDREALLLIPTTDSHWCFGPAV